MNLTVLQSIFLGIVQGLTELLPISSSAHLTVLPWLMWNIEDIGAFDVALHAGTLLAIGIFFFKDWINLLTGAYKNVFKKEKTFEGKMFLYLVLATIPGGLIGFVLDDKLDLFLETKGILASVSVIASALIVMGVLLYFIDKKAIELEPTLFEAYFSIGQIHLLRGELDEAAEAFKSAAQSKEIAAKAYYQLAKICTLKANEIEAISYIEYAIEIEPSYRYKAEKEPMFQNIKDYLTGVHMVSQAQMKLEKAIDEKVKLEYEKAYEKEEPVSIIWMILKYKM